MNSKLVILDANVIIELFKRNLFKSILTRYHIHVPEIIKNECIFYLNAANEKVDIDLSAFENDGNFTVISAEAEDYAHLALTLKEDFYRTIDDGEKEALAIIHKSEDDTILFCSGDLPAIKALGVIGRSAQGLSLENLLGNIGQKPGNLRAHFTQKVLEKEAAKAYQEKELYLK